VDVPKAPCPPAATGGGQCVGEAAGVDVGRRRGGTEDALTADVPLDACADHARDHAGHAGIVEPRRSGTTRRWLGALLSVTASLAVLAIAAVAVALTLVPTLVSGQAVTVLSASMTPALPPGSVLVDRPVATDSLRVGDVITYDTTDEVSGAPILITHRIVAIESGSAGPTFITQGDANEDPDTRPVNAAQIRGKVWYHVPYIGVARNFLLAQGAGLILGGAIALVAAVWFLIRLVRSDPKPAGSAAEPPRHGRHRARNSVLGTALAGLLVTGTHLVAHSPGTLAQFSDQQTVRVEISVGSTDPAR
jgi:signal peptidase I